jgi:hypothetical protein
MYEKSPVIDALQCFSFLVNYVHVLSRFTIESNIFHKLLERVGDNNSYILKKITQ